MEEDPLQERHPRTVQGRTRWRRFATLTVPAVAATGAILFAMADGAIAASFAVSGSTFKVSADKLVGTGFVQYGGVASEKGATATTGNHPVAIAGMGEATITGMCQSVTVPGLPVSVILRAGNKGRDASATGLMFDMTSMRGDASFRNLNIGQDASTLTKAGGSAHGSAGGFGQQADSVTLTNVKQVAWAASAGTFTLPDLDLQVSLAKEECFK
jgi:hypothetical protein